ncbi:MAG: type VI secretion system contractile sheath large subunit [Pseudomonadota bacterium]|nr:type VI secretion system contractile sheath large subunit [Pseudomonadota bacterium]
MSENKSNPEAAAQGAVESTDAPLLEQIMAQTRLKPADEGYDIAKKGVEVFISELLSERTQGEQRANKAAVDALIAEIDDKLSAQLDEILHQPKFQELESAWRGLKLLVDRTDFRENNRIELLNASKEDLLEDFEDSPEISQSGLYKLIYGRGYGQFGGEPVAATIGNYSFTPNAPDMKLLQDLASVGAMSHAPFIGAAAPEFFGVESFEELPNLKDLAAHFEGPKYAKWRSFRESEDSRYVGLTLPRFLLRTPYDPDENPVRAFQYRENVHHSHDAYLWGNTSFAFATRLTESFAKYRWCPNIIGPQSGGAVEDLPLHHFESMGQLETKIPTEILVSDRREYELAEEGFIALTMRKDSDNAAFFSANSVQKPKLFGNSPEAKEQETNYRLGTRLPYIFIISRLAHYIKVLQREQIGGWKDRGDLERELNKWIRQYVADQENPNADVRSRRPLRAAKVAVEDVEGNPGWYRVAVSVRPHFKYMGASFDLSLVGRLDQSEPK